MEGVCLNSFIMFSHGLFFALETFFVFGKMPEKNVQRSLN